MQGAVETREKTKARDFGTSGAPRALSIEESARKAGMGRSLHYEYLTGARQPKLPSFKAGKRRLILDDDHAAWLAEMARG